MTAIVDAVQNGRIAGAEVAVVISDKPNAAGLDRAIERGVETAIITRNKRPREEHDAEIIATLQAHGVELVCLAGYMRLLSPGFIQAFPNRIVNIHPSLLPAFPGLDAQAQAFDYGAKITGCTVHFVDEHLDHGAIILQKAVGVADTDTAETLSAKILAEEHGLYVEAVAQVVAGKYKIEGRRVISG